MDRLLSDDLWPTVKRLGKKAARKRAAIAYVTNEEYLSFGEGDELITDASDAAIASGQTSARVLSDAVTRGAKVFSLSGLHAKVILLDGTAILGSANLSASSATSLIEAAWLSDGPTLVSSAHAFIREIQGQAAEIDARFLKRILAIKVTRRGHAPRGSHPRPRIKSRPPQTWILGVYELLRAFPDEQAAVEKGEAIASERIQRDESEVEYIRWTGRSRFRSEAREGDSVITIWSEGKPRRVKRVYSHTPILCKQETTRSTLFFIESFPDAEETAIPWGKFKALLKRVGETTPIGQYSARELTQERSEALHQLWKD